MRKSVVVPLFVLLASFPIFAEAGQIFKINNHLLVPILIVAASVSFGMFFTFLPAWFTVKRNFRLLFFLAGPFILGGLASTLISYDQGLTWPDFVKNIFFRGLFMSVIPLIVYIFFGYFMDKILYNGMTVAKSVFLYVFFFAFFICFAAIEKETPAGSLSVIVLVHFLCGFIPCLATILLNGFIFVGFLREDWWKCAQE